MRRSIPALAATAALLAAAPYASAHVTANPSEATSGGYSMISLRVPHGCEESPTTKLTVQVPDGIYSVTPEAVPGWRVAKTMEPLDPPVDDGHGGEYTERVATVTWTGGPLAADQFIDFGLSMKMPETEGAIDFPVVQTCETGVERWIEPMVEGQEEPEYPAPQVTLTPAVDAGDGATTEPVALETASASSDSDDTKTNVALGLGIGGLVLGAAGLGIGLMARRGGRQA